MPQTISLHKLPLKLLSRIFIICFYNSTEDLNAPSDPRNPVEMTLSSVCSKWRSVALHTPALWSVLTSARTRMQAVAIETYRARSRSHSLTVEIAWCTVESPYSELDAWPLLSSTILEARRLKSLTLSTGDSESLYRAILILCPIRVPILDTLTIYSWDDEVPNGRAWMMVERGSLAGWIFKRGAPNLRAFTLHGQPLSFCHPPMKNITYLVCSNEFSTFERRAKDRYVNWVLSSIPQVETLALNGLVYRGPPPEIVDKIELAHLTTLAIVAPDDPQLDASLPLMELIYAPNLQVFRVLNMTPPTYSALLREAHGTRARPFPHLLHFDFRPRSMAEIPDNAVYWFLRVIPSITSLTAGPGLVEQLSRDAQGVPLPALQNFYYDCPDKDEDGHGDTQCPNSQVLEVWVALRAKRGLPLQKVRLPEKCLKSVVDALGGLRMPSEYGSLEQEDKKNFRFLDEFSAHTVPI